MGATITITIAIMTMVLIMMLVRLPNKILLHFFAILFWGAIYIQVAVLKISVRLIKLFEITASQPNDFITVWNAFLSIGVAIIVIFAGLTFIRRNEEITAKSWIVTIIFSVFSADLLFNILPNLFIGNLLWSIISVVIYCLAAAIYCQSKIKPEDSDFSEDE